MIKKTFFTLKQSPAVLLATAVPFALIAVAMIPMFFSFSSFFGTIMTNQGEMDSMTQGQMMTSMSGYIASMGLTLFIELAAIFLAVPVIMNRIYEMCSGVNEPGWVKRGLARCWWKPFVTGLILYMCIFLLVIAAVILMFIPILGALIYMLSLMAFYVWALVAFTAVIAEDDFGTGLGRVFPVGGKYFFKMAGVILLTALPLIVIYGAAISVFVTDTAILSATADYVESQEFVNKLLTFIGIFSGAAAVYYIFALPFTYTYSMHQYLYNRGLIFATEPGGNTDKTSQQEVTY